MADTTVAAANVVEQWDSKFFREYIRANLFKDYMGTSSDMPIVIKENLLKSKGDKITVPLVRKLTGAGITGNNTLEGNEEALVNYGHQITVDALRNGVRITELEEQRSPMSLREASREMLMGWMMDQTRDDIIDALQSPVVDGKTKYADASEAQKDAWLAANLDRIQFGSLRGNTSGTDHSASLANITLGQTLSGSLVSLAKRLAKNSTNGAIRPMRVNGSEEFFIMFVGSYAFRDFKNDPTVQQANRDGWLRGRNNPIFRDGDILWDGVIVREVPEIAVIAGVGDSGIDVAPCFLAGAQAVGVAYAQRTKSTTQVDDYGFRHGVAVSEIRGIEKLMYNSVQNGVVTVYVDGSADS